MDNNTLQEAVRVITQGGVVALPFERLFGLAVNALDPDSVRHVAQVKDRTLDQPDRRPISVILPSLDALKLVAQHVTPLAEELASRHWPGLLTMIVQARSGLPPELTGPTGLIGVRLPGPCPAARLATASGCILTATSANKKGAVDALSHRDVEGLDGIDLIVPGEVDGPPGSTVVDVSGDRPVVLRAGAVAIEEDPNGY